MMLRDQTTVARLLMLPRAVSIIRSHLDVALNIKMHYSKYLDRMLVERGDLLATTAHIRLISLMDL